MELEKCEQCKQFFLGKGTLCDECKLVETKEMQNFMDYIEENKISYPDLKSEIVIENILKETNFTSEKLDRLINTIKK